MGKFTLRYASHAIPIWSPMLFIPSTYFPFLKELLVTYYECICCFLHVKVRPSYHMPVYRVSGLYLSGI